MSPSFNAVNSWYTEDDVVAVVKASAAQAHLNKLFKIKVHGPELGISQQGAHKYPTAIWYIGRHKCRLNLFKFLLWRSWLPTSLQFKRLPEMCFLQLVMAHWKRKFYDQHVCSDCNRGLASWRPVYNVFANSRALSSLLRHDTPFNVFPAGHGKLRNEKRRKVLKQKWRADHLRPATVHARIL